MIKQDFWQKKSEQLRLEAEEINQRLSSYEGIDLNFYEDGLRVLELSQRAYSLCVMQKPEEKRKLLNVLLSNCTYDSGTLCPTYRKPFDVIAKGVETQNWLGIADNFRNLISAPEL